MIGMMVVRIEVGISIQFIFFLVSIMSLEILLGSLLCVCIHSFIHSLSVYLTNVYGALIMARD